MYAEERQMLILLKIENEGSVSVSSLAKEFNVSEVTIRGDLKKLESRANFQRTHGGAFMPKDSVPQARWDFRASSFSSEKEKIGEKAKSLIHPGETIFIDTGTTMECLARHLRSVGKITVITFDLRIAMIASMWPNVQLVFTGGYLRADLPLWGPDCVRTILAHSIADKFFLSVSGISLENGLMETNSLAMENKHIMSNAAKETILLVDTSKFGLIRGSIFDDISTVDIMISGKNMPDEYKKLFKDKGVDVTLV